MDSLLEENWHEWSHQILPQVVGDVKAGAAVLSEALLGDRMVSSTSAEGQKEKKTRCDVTAERSPFSTLMAKASFSSAAGCVLWEEAWWEHGECSAVGERLPCA